MVETTRPNEQIKTETIDTYYSIPNEIDFVRKTEGLSSDEQAYYIRENVMGFLGEFVGKIPYKKISYVLKDDGLDYAGLKVMDSYHYTASQAGAGSRDWYETQGMQRVEDALQDPSINRATVLSPPKLADYGFAFHFEKQAYDPRLSGVPITEYILRYDETMNSVLRSEQIATAIHPENEVYETYQSTNDYLEKPMIGFDANGSTRHKLFDALSIDTSIIQTSEAFEQAVQHEMGDWIAWYTASVQELASRYTEPTQQEINQLEFVMNAIYNRAQALKKELDSGTYQPRKDYHENHIVVVDQYDNQLLEFYGRQEAVVTGGGSCPVTKKITYLGTSEIFDQFSYGGTVSGLLDIEDSSEHFVCPRCEKQADGPVGNKCPSCGLTKEEAANSGYATC